MVITIPFVDPVTEKIEGYLGTKAPKSAVVYRNIWKAARRTLGVSPHLADESKARELIVEWKARDVAVSSQRNKLSVLSSIQAYLLRIGEATSNPYDLLCHEMRGGDRAQVRPHKLIPFDRIRALLDVPRELTLEGKRDRAVLCCLLGGALRIGEAAALRVSDIKATDSGTLYLFLRKTKAGVPARQPLPAWAAERVITWKLLAETLAGSSEAPLWPKIRRGRIVGAMTSESLRRMFKNYCDEIGLTGFTPHSCRATAITKLLSDGVSYREVQDFSRHSSIAMVERYDKRRFGIDESVAKLLKF